MTGIKNRYYFEQRVLEEIKIADYNKQPLALLLFDIDNFKKVNDTYGHDIGDKIIIRITQATTNIIRATDLFARWGGEEFVILMPNTSLTTAKERAEQLRQAIEEISHPETGSVTLVSVSLNGKQPKSPPIGLNVLIKLCIAPNIMVEIGLK